MERRKMTHFDEPKKTSNLPEDRHQNDDFKGILQHCITLLPLYAELSNFPATEETSYFYLS